MDDPNDLEFFVAASKLLHFDLSLKIQEMNKLIDYWTNPKVFFYALLIVREHDLSPSKKRMAARLIWRCIQNLTQRFDDFWDTNYIQKSIFLCYYLLDREVERNDLISKVAKQYCELVCKENEVIQLFKKEEDAKPCLKHSSTAMNTAQI